MTSGLPPGLQNIAFLEFDFKGNKSTLGKLDFFGVLADCQPIRNIDRIRLSLILFSILTSVLPTRFIWAQATQFEKGTEQIIEETKKVEDGKKVHTIRSGQPSERKGGPKVGEIEAGEVDQVQRRRKSLNLSAFGFGPFISSNVGSSWSKSSENIDAPADSRPGQRKM